MIIPILPRGCYDDECSDDDGGDDDVRHLLNVDHDPKTKVTQGMSDVLMMMLDEISSNGFVKNNHF